MSLLFAIPESAVEVQGMPEMNARFVVDAEPKVRVAQFMAGQGLSAPVSGSPRGGQRGVQRGGPFVQVTLPVEVGGQDPRDLPCVSIEPARRSLPDDRREYLLLGLAPGPCLLAAGQFFCSYCQRVRCDEANLRAAGIQPLDRGVTSVQVMISIRRTAASRSVSVSALVPWRAA